MASTAWLGSPRHRPTRCAASGGDARPETAPAAAPPPDPARPPPLPPYTLPPGVSPVLIARPADVRDAADMLHAAPVVGMDCEWGPDPPGGGRPGRGRRRPARYAPVETLQLATAGAAFVFDVRALREEGAGGDALEALLAPLFRAPAPLLAGHSLRGDLARLAATLPHLTAAARAAPPAPRGGVLEFANACALLINLPGHDGGAPRGPPRLYSNAFFRLGDDRGGGGLAVSWWPSPGQGRAARLTRRLLGPEGDGVGAEAPVLLFARLAGGKKSAYVLLGRLEAAAVDWTAAHGGGEVAWRLVDVDAARARGGRTVAALLEAGGLDV